MKLQVLGCAGGIGGRERFTTCLRIDEDILLDAGTGLASLELDQLAKIDHIFVTHSHLDHVAGLALLVDAVMGKRMAPITVHATAKVIATLKEHLFNWLLWPDFTTIPTPETPILCWAQLEHGAAVELDGRVITSHPVNHTVDAVGYWVHAGKDGFLFTGDMASTPQLWVDFAKQKRLTTVIVDCSFSNAESDLANVSKHFCPQALVDDIAAMSQSIDFLIYHLKPGQEELIMQELKLAGGKRKFDALRRGDTFVFA